MKICIIGASGHYVYALRGIKADKNSEVVGISPGCEGENIDKLVSQVSELGFKPIIYNNFSEMLVRLKPDIAVINTFFYKNSEIAIDAMYRGINVYIEKPVATTLQDLDKLIDVHQKTNVKLSTMFGIRYTPHFWTAYNLIKSNQIGEVRLIHAQKSYKLGIRPDFYKRRETYGGTIPWVGCHAIDWIYWFSGKKFKSVFAAHSKLYNNQYGDLEVSATCNFILEDETLATVNIDYLRPKSAPTHDDDRLRIVGTNGIVEVMHNKVFMLNESLNGMIEVPLQESPLTFYDFIKEVREEGSCLVSANDAFYVTKACLLARQAADENRTIEFE